MGKQGVKAIRDVGFKSFYHVFLYGLEMCAIFYSNDRGDGGVRDATMGCLDDLYKR